MLVEELPPFIIGNLKLPDGSDHITHFHLTINKDDGGEWSAGYCHFDTGRILLATNGSKDLDEVAIRLKARVQRYVKLHRSP